MKRISVFTIVVLILVPSITNAHYYNVCDRFRIRYSPHAFSYKYPSGLICGSLEYSPYAFSSKYPCGLVPSDFYYSPYAFSYNNTSGLVPDSFIYSPYAFSTKNPSGLVSAYRPYFYLHYYLPYEYDRYAFNCKAPGLVDNNTYCNANDCGYEPAVKQPAKYPSTPHETGLAPRFTQRPKRDFYVSDGKEVIYNYLKSKNIKDFDVDRILKIDNKTISVNFVFRDKNIIIKYSNPEEIKVLMQQSGYKRDFYDKYEQQWKDFCQKQKENGWQVYLIESANNEEILNELSLYRKLIEG